MKTGGKRAERKDEGLTTETPALETLYSGQFALSIQLIIPPSDAAQCLSKLTLVIHEERWRTQLELEFHLPSLNWVLALCLLINLVFIQGANESFLFA